MTLKTKTLKLKDYYPEVRRNFHGLLFLLRQ
jgi:hypothetical protein